MPDLKSAKGQTEHLAEGCVDIVRREDLEARIESALAAGRPLVVKVGFDPSAPDIHLGPVVLMRKMRQFQECGHQVVFVVGDFTAMIGDPSGRSRTRPQLAREQIAANAETYRRQAAKILDDSKTQYRYNSEWIEKLGSAGLVRLAAKYNVARMLERRDFRQRFDAGQSIAVHEFLYPLAQAYDSVVLKADVELGGTDQLFNLNVGRDLMPEYGLPPQIVMTTPLLEGLDGVEKMSKSLGNYVAVEDPPNEMFGKLMSMSDALMWKYWKLLGGVPSHWVEIAKAAVETGLVESNGRLLEQWPRFVAALGWKGERLQAVLHELGGAEGKGPASPFTRERLALARIRLDLGAGSFHPKEIKLALARRIVTDFHGRDASRAAEEEFERVFSRLESPAEIAEIARPTTSSGVPLAQLIVDLDLARSTSAAIRLIRQGAVSVDGQRVDAVDYRLDSAVPVSFLLRVGKRQFRRVRFEATSEEPRAKDSHKWFKNELERALGWARSIGVQVNSRFDDYEAIYTRIVEARKRGEIEAAEGLLEGYALIHIHKHLSSSPGENLSRWLSQAFAGPVLSMDESAETGTNQPRNIAFELLLGGDLQAAGFRPDFSGEADLSTRVGEAIVYVECKRTQTQAGVKRGFNDAADQLLRRNRAAAGVRPYGIVALSIGKIVTEGRQILTAESRAAAALGLSQEVERFIRQNEEIWQRREDPGVDAVLVYLSTVAHVRSSNSLFWARFLGINPIASKGETPLALIRLGESLRKVLAE